MDDYDQLSVVEDILSNYNNSIEILKDKLKSNSYLVFKDYNVHQVGSGCSSYSENGIFKIIRMVYENSKENVQFYENIFQLWFNLSNKIGDGGSSSLFSNSSRNINSDIDIVFTFAVKQSNYVAAKVLITKFMKRSEDLTRSIIEYSSLATLHKFESYYDFKLFKYLNNKYSLSNGISTSDPAVNNSSNVYQFDHIKVFESITLKQLLKLVNTNGHFSLFNFTNEQLDSTVKSQLELPSQYSSVFNLSTASSINMVWDLLFEFSQYNNNNNNNQFINKVNVLVANLEAYYQLPQSDIEIIINSLLKEQNHYKLSRYLMVILINGRDDGIEFIEGLIEKYQVLMNTIFTEYLGFKELLPFIKSTSTLDFYYKYYKSVAFNNSSNNWELVTSLSVLNHYEMLMDQIGYTFSFNNIKFRNHHYGSSYKVLILESVIKALKGSKIYKIVSISGINYSIDFYLESLEDIIYDYFNSGRESIVFQLFREYYKSRSKSEPKSFHIEDRYLGDPNNKFISYVVNNYTNIIKSEHLVELVLDLDQFISQDDEYENIEFQNDEYQDLESNSISFKISEDYLFKLLYSRKKYSDIFKNLKLFNIFESLYINNSNGCIIRNEFILMLIQFILNGNLISSKKKVINSPNQNHQNKPLEYSIKLLKRILTYSASFGNLALFKFIESSIYYSILRGQDPKRFFNEQELKLILKSAFQKSNIHKNYLGIMNILSLSNIKLSENEI